MARTTTPLHLVGEFLEQKRLAIVGVSRNPKDFSRRLLDELRSRGYDIVAVHPDLRELDGAPCFKRVQDITTPVDGALLLTSRAVTPQVLRDCEQAGISRVWVYGMNGRGRMNEEAWRIARDGGLRVVDGYCPFMFLPKTPPFHRWHGFFLKLTGAYPR